MTVKRTPHHDLASIQAKFVTVETLDATRTALLSAQALGYGKERIIEIVQLLERRNFVKSETAHSPPNHKIWHDTYNLAWNRRWLYLKFAGETLIDIKLTSFKEQHYDQ